MFNDVYMFSIFFIHVIHVITHEKSIRELFLNLPGAVRWSRRPIPGARSR